MTTNDGLKTTKQYAFRIDGITSRDGVRATGKELESIRTLEEVLPMLVRLLPRGVYMLTLLSLKVSFRIVMSHHRGRVQGWETVC